MPGFSYPSRKVIDDESDFRQLSSKQIAGNKKSIFFIGMI